MKRAICYFAVGIACLAACNSAPQQEVPVTPTLAATATVTATPTATAMPTATAAPTATTIPSPPATPTATTAPTATITPVPEELCRAAFLCYLPEAGYEEFMSFAAENGILKHYPALEKLSEEQAIVASGGEWYLLEPMMDTVQLTVYECVLDEVEFTLKAGGELLVLSPGEPVLLCGNVSDIFPSFMVVITEDRGRVISYAPGLSLRDGALLTEEGILDGTIYAEGQLEE